MKPVVSVKGGGILPSCAAEWNGLVDRMAYPTPFVTWAWMASWAEHFAEDRQIRLLMLRDGTTLRGILPLIEASATSRFGRIAGCHLEYLGVDTVYPDHLDVIAGPDHAAQCCEVLLQHLADRQAPWDTVRLPMVTDESALHRHFADTHTGWRTRTRTISVAPYLRLDHGSFDAYLATHSRKQRYKLRSYSRKLLEGAGVEYRRIAPREHAAALERLFELHEKRASAKSAVSTFAIPAVRAFHRTLLARLPPDQVVLRALQRADRTIGMFYGFCIGNRLFYFQLGHDPEWAEFSPGTVMVAEALREAFEAGWREFNFLQGDEAYKSVWTREMRPLFEIRLYRDSVRGAAAHALADIKDGLRCLLRRQTPPAATPVQASCPTLRAERTVGGQ